MSPRLQLAIALIALFSLTAASPTPFPPNSRSAPGRPAAGRSVPAPLAPQKKVSDLIHRQEQFKVNNSVMNRATSDSLHVVVSIPKQRAYLMVGDEIGADSPISSGKRGHGTPQGKFTVLEKDPNHHSSLYGNFCDSSGRVVRAGVSAHIDAAPSGTHFAGAEMKWFMRLTSDGVGMHIGILPGYPASHGCVRMSSDGAKFFYDHVKVGTPVAVGDY
jgi:lipoprotein-anchoring transpeptidase ErfK/SrfK